MGRNLYKDLEVKDWDDWIPLLCTSNEVKTPEDESIGYGVDITVIGDEDIKKLKDKKFLEACFDGEYSHYLYYDNELCKKLREHDK